MSNRLDVNKIKDFVNDSIEQLTTTDYTCCEYKLDNDLSLFVGWSAGYGTDVDENDTSIRSEGNPDWAINIGIKSNHEYMKTDFDFLNFPYNEETGDVWDTSMTVTKNGISDSDIEWYIEQYQEIRKAYEDGEIVIDGAPKIEKEKDDEETVSFQEIVEKMDAAGDYADLYEAASYIVNSGLRLDVENLIGQCEDDGDEIDQAVSVVTSDLLDMYLNSKNVENLNESKKVEEKKLTEEVKDQVYDIAEYILNEIGNKKDVTMDEYNNLLEKGKAKYNFNDDDLDADVRTILSMNGFGTNFESGDLSTELEESKLVESANTLDNSDEEDLATYLYTDAMEYASFDSREKRCTSYELQSFEEVQDWYDSNITEETYNKVANIVKNVIENTVYYNDSESAGVDISIELNDNRTMNDIKFPEDYDENEGYYFQQETYPMMVNEAAKEFEQRTGEQLKFLGRSGRHVCVKNNFLNAYKYNELKAVQQELEGNLIDDVNAMLNETEPVEESKKLTEDADDNYAEAYTFAYQTAKAIRDRGYKVSVQGEDNIIVMSVKQDNAEMNVSVYVGEEDGAYGFEENTVGLGGDTISDVTILPIYVNGWDYDSAAPRQIKINVGDEIWAIFKETANTTPREVANIVADSFGAAYAKDGLKESKKVEEGKMTFNMEFKKAESKIGEGRKILNDILENEELDEATDGFIRDTIKKICDVEMDIMNFKDSEKITATESKKLEEKDTKQEYQDYCKDLGLDCNKKSSINKFLNDYAKNLATIQGTKDFEEKMAQVKKELRESISKKEEAPNIELNTTSNILKGIADKINKTCSNMVTAQTAQIDDVAAIRLTRKGNQDLITLFDSIVNVMNANNISKSDYEIDLRGNDLILAVKNMTI